MNVTRVNENRDWSGAVETSHTITAVAVDCIALNYLGKHKRKIRGINLQESNQQQ